MALFEETFPPYHPFGSRVLTLGSAGTDVAVLQALYNLMLETMTPPQGPMGAPIAISGSYDARTAQAVRNIQAYFGLAPDGIAGPSVYWVYGQGVEMHTTYGGPVYGSRQLSLGMSGGDVTILQNRLNCFRYARLLGGPATGVFNPATQAAVLAFKQDAVTRGDIGLPANSVVGNGCYDASWLYTFAGGRAIETGRNGFDVVFLQAALQDLSYYSGRITGYYDAATKSAVMAFQTASGIAVDGIVGPSTYYQLGLANNVPAPSPLGVAWPIAPVPQVTVCSIGLASQTADLHPYGEATLVVNQLEGFESLDVVGNMLNPPYSYGQYNSFLFTLTDPVTGQVIENIAMVPTNKGQNPGDWAGTFSPGVKAIPAGTVSIYPVNTITGQMGPLLLQGHLKNCH
ncbi:MAG: peptidoglycan-binding protein [Sulfobacillus acidophilus]|uniref:Peptidoglycan-binding protein n=1 Tax=Sulfobacillus acidophilus TaxID=53633 RepID=A0A2T2WHA0_9FIRM|nr:MAG: peptidoglycan-binding protein [Sulfobacillus acidophilus]